MKRLSPTLFATALASILLTASNVHASFISWAYNWDRSPDTISADIAGTGGIILTNGSWVSAVGSSMTVATNLKTVSTAPADHPATFTSVPYNLTMTLTDAASLGTDTLNFSGKIDGTLSTSFSKLANTFTSPTTLSTVLGGNTYTVSVGPFAPPGPPGSTNAGGISAFVEVSGPAGSTPPPVTPPPGPPPPVTDQPEPSTALLSCLGISCMGLASWRRRKSQRLAA